LYRRSLVCRLNLDCRHTDVNWPMTLEANPMRLSVSGVERPHELMSLPRYVKRSVTSTICSWMVTAHGWVPYPAFWRWVFGHDVCRPIVWQALSKPARISVHRLRVNINNKIMLICAKFCADLIHTLTVTNRHFSILYTHRICGFYCRSNFVNSYTPESAIKIVIYVLLFTSLTFRNCFIFSCKNGNERKNFSNKF